MLLIPWGQVYTFDKLKVDCLHVNPGQFVKSVDLTPGGYSFTCCTETMPGCPSRISIASGGASLSTRIMAIA